MIHTKLLAIKLPGGDTITGPTGLKSSFQDLSSFVSPLIEIAFLIAGFLAFYFLVWGAFQYIMAQGDKEGIGKAKARITYAIIGLIIVLLSYFIARFAFEIFTPTKGALPF